ncbi:hypothetical protein ACFWAR_20085 [Streptomyces sp. NPDC059917]|uniref:hypothetical protein n=1 Tax=Streptomyces sp. NPDC059917 TaxID=3347002 RepID=UPI003660150E
MPQGFLPPTFDEPTSELLRELERPGGDGRRMFQLRITPDDRRITFEKEIRARHFGPTSPREDDHRYVVFKDLYNGRLTLLHWTHFGAPSPQPYGETTDFFVTLANHDTDVSRVDELAADLTGATARTAELKAAHEFYAAEREQARSRQIQYELDMLLSDVAMQAKHYAAQGLDGPALDGLRAHPFYRLAREHCLLVAGGDRDYSALTHDTRRRDLLKGRRPVVRAEYGDLVETQPTELTAAAPDRRHTRYANLFWEKHESEAFFVLRRCPSDHEFSRGGVPRPAEDGDNFATLALSEDQDISGIRVLPDDGGRLPSADENVPPAQGLSEPWPVYGGYPGYGEYGTYEDFEAFGGGEAYDGSGTLSDVLTRRTAMDPADGSCRTQRSYRGREKVNARCRVTMDRAERDSGEWAVKVAVCADSFSWDVLFWDWRDHRYVATAEVRTEAGYRARYATDAPAHTVRRTHGRCATGGYAGELSFTLPADSGRYVVEWTYDVPCDSPDKNDGFPFGFSPNFSPDRHLTARGTVVVDTSIG